MLRDRTDESLAAEFRSLRNLQRPLFNELQRRGYTVSEVHGHSRVPVTGFENICIAKPTVVKL
jgi:hypothetical protein